MRAPLIAVSLTAALMMALGQAAQANPSPGQPAPAYAGKDLDGRALDLASFKGRVLVVNFWATWCPPCRAEMPLLDAVYKRHKGEGVGLVGLSADRRRDLGDVRKVMSGFSYPASLISDAQINAYGAPSALPATYVIDGAGVVRFVFSEKTGPLTEAALERALASLIPPKTP